MSLKRAPQDEPDGERPLQRRVLHRDNRDQLSLSLDDINEMYGRGMAFAILWLKPIDAFASCCVCKHWNDILCSPSHSASHEAPWEQVCKNANPGLARDFKDRLQKEPRLFSPGISKAEKYRRVAFGLFDETEKPRKVDQFFASVELYRLLPADDNNERPERVVEASWDSSLSFPEGFRKKNTDRVLKGKNPYSSEMKRSSEARSLRRGDDFWDTSPVRFAAAEILGSDDITNPNRGTQRSFMNPRLCMKVVVFRKKDLKSFCLIDEETSFYNANCTEFDVSWGFDIGELPSDGSHHSRNKASYLGCEATLKLKLNLCRYEESEETPGWCSRLQSAFDDDEAYVPDQEDSAALERLSDFQFDILDFGCRLTNGLSNTLSYFSSEAEMVEALKRRFF